MTKILSREHRDRIFNKKTIGGVRGPDFYTHHDNAMKAIDHIHSTFE